MKKILQILTFAVSLVLLLVTLTGCSNNDKNVVNTAVTITSSTNLVSTENVEPKEVSTSLSDAKEFLKELKSLKSEEVLVYADEQMKMPNVGETIAVIHIKNYGDVKLKFFADVAPKAVENFLTHAKDGYYNGLTFHRIIADFMIQGGDPLGNGRGGESIWKEDFGEELSAKVLPYRGSICMASGGTGTNSIGSQFFINTTTYNSSQISYLNYYGLSNLKAANQKYGGSLGALVGQAQYTTFGQVFEGMDIVQKVADEAIVEDSNGTVLKENQPIIESIEVLTYSAN